MEYVNEFLEIMSRGDELKAIKPVYEQINEYKKFSPKNALETVYFFNQNITKVGLTSDLNPIKDYAKSLYSEIKDFKKGLPSELREELSSEIVGLEKLCKDFF